MSTSDLYEAARQAVVSGFVDRSQAVEQFRELYGLDSSDKRPAEAVDPPKARARDAKAKAQMAETDAQVRQRVAETLRGTA